MDPSARPPEAGYGVYLVDPGPNQTGLLILIQEVTGARAELAARYLRELPSRIAGFETEEAARNLADRFRDFDAVAVVRPANSPPLPPPVEEERVAPDQPLIRIVLLVLAVVQIGLSAVWLRDGRILAGVFGLLLALCVVLYAWKARSR